MTRECPQDHLLAEFLEGETDESTACAVREHLDRCDLCADVVAVSVSDAKDLLGRVGRYVALYRVGSGGMGDVYAAYDPELDRKVAIKLHHAKGDDELRVARLIHEARSAARLNHPNVVRVYDAGRLDDGRAFVAMELVAGTTLRGRIEADRRSWRDVASEMLLAGRGLAAAHAAGLVHGDFKPDNVLVADDGRILVTDFGLALRGETGGDPSTGDTTHSGPMAGTPGYMSPEQLEGRTANAASDQFAYAITFYEALCGVRPFAGVAFDEQLASFRAGAVTGARWRRPVPRWLRRVLRRGLACDPGQRYPDLVALLRDVERGLRRRAVSVVAVAVATAAFAGWWLAHAQDSAAVCGNASDPVAAVWSSDRAHRLEAAVLASDSPLREAARDNLTRGIGVYADHISAALVDACEATHVRHVQSPALLDRRSACFERVLIDLDELVRAITSAGIDELPRALEAVASLPDLSRCDASAVLGDTPVGAGTRAALAPATRQLAKAKALLATGRFDDARSLLRTGAPTGTERAARALVAEWHLIAGKALVQLSEKTAAREQLEQALWTAEEVDDGVVAVDAIAGLIPLTGYGEDAAAEALRWARLAESMVSRRDGDRDQRAAIALALGRFYADHGDPARSVASCERALTLVVGSSGLRPAHVMLNLGRALKKSGRLLEAEVYVRQAASQLELVLGPQHPLISVALLNLGAIQVDAGRARDAVATLERALAISNGAYGERHVSAAFILTDLGLAQSRLDDPAAIDSYRAALAIFEAYPDHRDQAGAVLLNLSGLLIRLGKAADAVDAARQSLELNRSTRGEDDLETGLSRINLSEALLLSGEVDEAVAQAERAVAVTDAHVGSEHPYRSQALARLGLAQLAAGRRDAARSLATALAALERTGPPEAMTEIKQALATLHRR